MGGLVSEWEGEGKRKVNGKWSGSMVEEKNE